MFISINPATDQEIGRTPVLTAAEVEGCLQRAAAGFAAWRQTTLGERCAVLNRLADVYDMQSDRLARMATAEMGKPLTAATAEIAKCSAAFRYYAEHGPAMLERVRYDLRSGGRVELLRQPLGPVLAVMPWNFPFWQVARFLAPTILAGNVGLLKHASNVQGTATLIAAMMREADAPEGLFQNLAVRSKSVAAIIADRRVAVKACVPSAVCTPEPNGTTA